MSCQRIAADTNATSLAVTKTATPEADSVWFYQQPNDIGAFSPAIETVARSPISLSRQDQKGTITNLTANPAWPQDLTMDGIAFWGDVALFTKWKGPAAGALGYDVSSVTTSAYTVSANGALQERALAVASGFTNTANNGLKQVGNGSTPTSVIVTDTLISETIIPASAQLHECGFRFPDGDLQVDAVGNLTTTATDLTTLPINAGQNLWLGGEADVNKFDTAADYGLIRIVAIETNRLIIDKRQQPFAVDAGTGKQIDLYYGNWCRVVSVDHPDYTCTEMTVEIGYNLPAGQAYEYSVQSVINTLALATPLTDKATLDFNFVAKDIPGATTTRKAGTFRNFKSNEAFNTSADFARLRLQDKDENGLTTIFTDHTTTINNNVTPKNVLGTLGAAGINVGQFQIEQSMTTLFTDIAVTTAIRNNATSGFDMSLRNNDGGFMVDIPEMTIGDGTKSFPTNDKVEIALTNNAYQSIKFGYTISLSLFRYLPPKPDATA